MTKILAVKFINNDTGFLQLRGKNKINKLKKKQCIETITERTTI